MTNLKRVPDGPARYVAASWLAVITPRLESGVIWTPASSRFLHAWIPRVDCSEHGGMAQVKTLWAESKGRFTLLMERLIIDVLTDCATVTGTRHILCISCEAWGVME